MKQVSNASYKTTLDIGAGKAKQMLWYFSNIFFLKNTLNVFSGLKVRLLRLFGAEVGNGVVIKPGVNIKYPWKLSIDDYSWIGENVWIDNLSEVNIGKNVTVSQGAILLTGTHDHTRESFDFISFPIILEDGAWIGAKAMVTGGVTCHTHSILGVNSLAENNLKPYTVYKGNPAVAVMIRNIN